jgi:hypothetical protein
VGEIRASSTCDAIANDVCSLLLTDCDCGDCREEGEDLFSCFGEDVCPPLNCQVDIIDRPFDPPPTSSNKTRKPSPDSSAIVYLMRWSLIVVATAMILLAEI